MFYKLKANSNVDFHRASWDAEVMGLDPDSHDRKSLTFEIGTGNIEKVSKLIQTHKLTVLNEKDYAENELAYIYEEMKN
jgi:hypothetical protein